MMSVCFIRYFVGVCAGTVLLTGCSSGGGSPVPFGISDPMRVASMAPAAKNQEFVYVANTSISAGGCVGCVIVSKLQGNLVSTIPLDPASECVDKAGHVFIESGHHPEIFEYAYGSTTVIQQLNEGDYELANCSVDPVTGDLAVTNAYPTSGSGAGSIAIFKKVKGRSTYGKPSYYSDLSMAVPWGITYDAQGNLFVSGARTGGRLPVPWWPFTYPSNPSIGKRSLFERQRHRVSSVGFLLAELLKGSKKFKNLSFTQSRGTNPGGLGWDGKYVVVQDPAAGTLYRVQVNASRATVVGSSNIGGKVVTGFGGPLQFSFLQSGPTKSVQANEILMGTTGLYTYPAGWWIQNIAGSSCADGCAISAVISQ